MNSNHKIISVVLVALLFLSLGGSLFAQNRTSLSFIGAAGLPLGDWSDRWNVFSAGEVNLKYKFARNTGFMLIVGRGVSDFAGLSQWEVFDESKHGQMNAEFRDDVIFNTSRQSGNIEQIPMGFGFFHDQDFGIVKGYGSLAMIVYNWEFQRSQELDYTVQYEDGSVRESGLIAWDDAQNGTTVGGQLALGALYKIRQSLYVDLSFAYHLINISAANGALAYYGYPARQIPGEDKNELIDESNGQVDFLQVRLGLRIGG